MVAEIVEQDVAPALGRFGEAKKRVELLHLHAFALVGCVGLLNEAAAQRNVVETIEHHGFGRQAVTTGAARLLIVGFNAAGQIEMRYEAYIRLVDAHAESNGSDHDYCLIANGKYGYKYEGKYSYQASFVGYFPAEKPKYSCIVVVNAPSRNVYYGNQVAGPVFRDIADKVYANSIEIHENYAEKNPASWAAREDGSSPIPYVTYGFQDDLEYILSTLEIPTKIQDSESRWAVALAKDSAVSIEVRMLDEDIENGRVPNVIGMTAQDAIFMLENAGLRVRIVGGGMIVRQSMKAGTPIYNGSEIILELT